MNQTSSLVTGGATLTAASLVPAVQWAATGFKGPMPPEVQLLVAGAIVTVIHAMGNFASTRYSAKTPAAPQ
jgi:hypothetical protein